MNENENTSNNTDTAAVIKELQILNQGIGSNAEKLDYITEYLITKDESAQEKAEKEQQKAEEEEQKLQKAAEEKQQEEEEQTETYTELLSDIRDQVSLTNNILSGQIFFMGVLFGVALLSVLWNRFIR